MSGYDGKKPETREGFIKLLANAKKEERKIRSSQGGRSAKPTIKGTAEMLGIHRDTLYQWMREFDVDFSDVDERQLVFEEAMKQKGPTYLIGEALMGEGNEIAHVDLLIGDKTGPIGQAFANGLSNLSAGHTPLLAVIRPNLPPKPHTLLVPKVTVKNMEQTSDSLLKDDLSLKNELYQYDFLFEIRDRILIKARADAIHQEIVRIKDVDLKEYNQIIDKMEDQIGGLKSQSHEGLVTAKEIWTKRDEIREEAQKYHKEFIKALNSSKEIKKQGWTLKKEINSLYREIDNWKKEFDKSPAERKVADNSRRLEEVLAKYKKGESLSLEELSLLVESGKMNE